MKNRVWVIIFSSLLLVCAVWWLFILNLSSPSKIAVIYQNGKLIEKIDLNCVTQEREITLSGENGENTILITPGHIKMKSAGCPDKLCVKHGELKDGGTPIVCLPNRVVIQFENTNDNSYAKTGVSQ